MDKKTYYKYLFLLTAIWNFLISLPFMFMYETFAINWGLVLPSTPIWIELFLIFVFIMGIGYFLIYRDISKNHGLVFIGILTKVAVFIIFLYFLIIGLINIILFSFSVVDLVTACLMVEFLLNYKKIE